MFTKSESVGLLVRLALTGAVLALLVCSPVAAGDGQMRTVTLAPHLTELVYEIGAQEHLVGVVEWSNWPEEAKALPRIGSAFRFDMEAILSLDTELALAWSGGTPPAVGQQLENLGIEVLWLQTRSLDEIAEAVELLGQRLETTRPAREIADRFRSKTERLRERYKDNPPASIFYQVSAQPLFTLGGRHVISEVFRTCGAHNIFDDLDTEAAAVDREAVIARQPDFIIAGSSDESAEALAKWEESRLVDREQTRLVAVDADLLVRPNLRIIEGIEFICELVAEAAN
ncbi:MAG TPA: cobalamin-binding protein [Wenzhouxiangella sp.]|nr:cobalamin-binding protein [Wenzhouxiangella sp.]